MNDADGISSAPRPQVFPGNPRCWPDFGESGIPCRREAISMRNFWRSLSFKLHLKLGRLTVSICFKPGSTVVRR